MAVVPTVTGSIDSADLVEPDPTAPPLPRGDTVPGGLFSAPRVHGFDEYVAEPLRRLTRHNLRTRAMVSGFGPKVRRSADTSSRALADRSRDDVQISVKFGAQRGLGHDLSVAEAEQSAALIRAGRSGQARRVMLIGIGASGPNSEVG